MIQPWKSRVRSSLETASQRTDSRNKRPTWTPMNIFNTPPSPCIFIHPREEANSHLFNPMPLLFSWILEVRGSKAVARDVMGGGWGCGRSPYGNSKGSKLVIRRSKGSKLPGCNFHPQIYDLASRGLYSIETTPLTAPPKGYCKSPPSNPQCHHAPSHTHTHIYITHTHPYWPFISLFLVCCTCHAMISMK